MRTKQKQTQDWKTTKATDEAIYALLLRGTDMLADNEVAVITVGNMTIDAVNDPEIKTDAGTGYFKKSLDGSQITPEWGDVTVTKICSFDNTNQQIFTNMNRLNFILASKYNFF